MQLSLSGTQDSIIDVSDEVFNKEFNEPLVHQAVTCYLAGSRAGTKAQKSRSQVKATGSKPWRQKGTGRARAGTVASPLWKGGGVTFAAKPRNYSQKINKKMYQGALRSILSELARQKRLLVVEDFDVDNSKTASLLEYLKKLKLDNQQMLIVTAEEDVNLSLAARNIHYLNVTKAAAINPVNLIQSKQVLISVATIRKIEERLSI
ncbi:50S ribosomal protein L4 [Candidatus Halobeggiatoa sp. HSG11]|nr:50S ribosomal protein L4 [Candidatus Halobeggiatoa sp. HSG11]